MPPDGDDYLRVQRREEGASRIHLDLHVADVVAAADAATALGATILARLDVGYVVLRSPGGLVFCNVGHPASGIPGSAAWPGIRRSRVYQVCLDVPPVSYDAECAFWAGLVGGTVEVLPSRPEFSWLSGPRQLALDVLLQHSTRRPDRRPPTSTSAPPTARPRSPGTRRSGRPSASSRTSGRCSPTRLGCPTA